MKDNYGGRKTGRGQTKCDGTRAETRFRLSAKRASPFKSAGASVHSTTGSRSVRISSSNAGYTMFRGSAKSTGYPLHSPVSPSLPLPCVTVCHHISTGVYTIISPTVSSKAWSATHTIHTTQIFDLVRLPSAKSYWHCFRFGRVYSHSHTRARVIKNYKILYSGRGQT